MLYCNFCNKEVVIYGASYSLEIEKGMDELINQIEKEEKLILFNPPSIGPYKCPICGKLLREREGKYGKFLGCSGYPQCQYTYDLTKRIDIYSLPQVCPKCNRRLTFRTGKYGDFIGCTGYPNCTYTFNIDKNVTITCLKCNKRMKVRSGKYGDFLGCTGYPNCKYTFVLK